MSALRLSTIKMRSAIFLITLAGMVALAGTVARSRGVGLPSVRITEIKQISHDGLPKTALVATDSEPIVTEAPGGRHLIARFSATGDRTVLSPALNGDPNSVRGLDLSGDQSKMLISQNDAAGDRQLWQVPLGAGSPQHIGVSAQEAAWSADGKKLIFVKGSSLNVANADGSDAHPVYQANGSPFSARFSPDAARIRFSLTDSDVGTTSLWEVAADGSNPHVLLADWPYKGNVCCGSWTPDGRYYIFQATVTLPNSTSVVTTLWALPETDNGAPISLTSGPISFGNPVVARDGKSLWSIGVRPDVEVVKYLSAKQKFVPVIPGLSATDLSFSRDGKWVTYVSIPEGALWKARANGADRLQLTSGADRAALPNWSPDGKQIAFVSMKPGGMWRLYLISSDGGEPRELLHESGSQIDANWSSDGSRLMFGAFNHDAGGLNIRILDFRTGQIEKVPGSEGLFSPRWSPDQQHIAALSPNGSALMRYDFDTQKWTRWIGSEGAVSYPVWSTDSQSLYFDDLVNGAESIRQIKIGETEAQPVFELGAMDRYLGALGPWSGRAPDGSWMFIRDRSTQEVYQLNLQLP